MKNRKDMHLPLDWNQEDVLSKVGYERALNKENIEGSWKSEKM